MEAAGDRAYEDFNPYFEWAREEGGSSLIVMLSGFVRHQLKIQLTSTPSLRISGERQITGNRWLRFNREFPIPPDCDPENVKAMFQGGLLYLKFPTLTKETTPKQPTAEAPPQKVDQQKAAPAQEVTPKAKEDKAEKSTNEVSEETPQKEKEPSDDKEKSKIETAASKDKAAEKEVRTNGLTDKTTAAAATSKDPEMNGPKTEAPSQKVNQQKAAEEVTPKGKEDKAETRTDEVSEQTSLKEKDPSYEKEKIKTETAASKDKVAQKKVRTNGLTDQTTEGATSKVPESNGDKAVTRSKTRLLDFTLSLGPTNQEYNEGVGDLNKAINKGKKSMNWVVVILLVVVLWLYVRNAFRSSLEGSKFQEL